MAGENRYDNKPSANAPVSLKKKDGEPLSRQDVQYDLLEAIFANEQAVFTSHMHMYQTDLKPENAELVSFKQMYLNALLHSGKLSNTLKARMLENTRFAVEFAKIAFLLNVGRLKTTMAFFPELNTPARTYHPIPSLQMTDENMHDGPRIKNALKGGYFLDEVDGPNSPSEVRGKLIMGKRPPCSVPNLIFVLCRHPSDLAAYFEPQVAQYSFNDLFAPGAYSAASRALVFLWLMYNFLEGSDRPNPFHDAGAAPQPGRIPTLTLMSEPEAAGANQDTPAELRDGAEMRARRRAFLERVAQGEGPPARAGKAEKAAQAAQARAAAAAAKEPAPPTPQREAKAPKLSAAHAHPRQPALVDSPRSHARGVPREAPAMRRSYSSRSQESRIEPAVPYVPYPPQESMLQYAWRTNLEVDPLEVSDGEGNDLGMRWDYERRLAVLKRVRGRDPNVPLSVPHLT